MASSKAASSVVHHLLLLLLCSLVLLCNAEEDRCTFRLDNIPYITFMGERLPNHTFIDIALLGDLPNTTIQCHTDLESCCVSSLQSGEWAMPNGDEIRIETGVGFGVRKFTQRIELVHGEASGSRMTGIYRCDMPTTAVNDVGKTARESVYVGLYAVNSLNIREIFLTENSDVNGDFPQFTITCVSAGGPVGCVVWRISKDIIPNPNTTSTLVDPVEGMYMHNLTVSKVAPGSYSCSVANDRPTSIYKGFFVDYAETLPYVLAVPLGPTSVHVIWGTVQPLKSTLGYRIYFRGPTNGSVDVDDPLINNYVLMGLRNNATYTVSVIGKSRHLPSDRTQANPVRLVPGQPELQLYSATADSVSFSWTMPPGSAVDSFEVKWERNHSQLATFRDTLRPPSNNYTVTGLKDYGNATYTITVTALNGEGSSTSSNMNFVANFAATTSSDGDAPESPESGSEGIDEGLIAGVVVIGLVILAIVVVVVGVLVYCYKSKSTERSRKPAYSLAGPVAVPPSVPLPPPRPDISTTSNRSYAPRVTTSTTTRTMAGEDQTYYTPTGYINPNPHLTPQQTSSAAASGGNSSATGQDEINTSGHGYDYITVQK